MAGWGEEGGRAAGVWMGKITWKIRFLPCTVSPAVKGKRSKIIIKKIHEVKGLGHLRNNNVSVSPVSCLMISLSQLCYLNQFR